MRIAACLLVGLCVAASGAWAGGEPPGIPFRLGKEHFRPGDSVVVDQVQATSPQLDVGAKVVVRGHYRLASAGEAAIGLFVTHRAPATGDGVAPEQLRRIQAGEGAFELSCEITYAGDLHVSLYPASGGESFGGVYIVPPDLPSP